MRRVEELVLEREKMTLEAFLLRYTMPSLVYRGASAQNPPGAEAVGFKTQVASGHSLSQRALQTGVVEGDVPVLNSVFPLEKADSSPYPDRISVGRTRTNDVQIRFARVSKSHAYFTWTPDRRNYSIVDAGATNGTFVNGNRLAKGQSAPLGECSYVALGPYQFLFMQPTMLYEFLLRIG